MLFDLQSKRRRRGVKVIYSLLAVLMAGGLILLGVGVGNGNGGLLNAFSNNGSGGNAAQSSQATAQLKSATAAVKESPNSASAWAGLLQARYTYASQGPGYDQSTDTYTATGKTELQSALDAWNQYRNLVTGTPALQPSRLAANASDELADYSAATLAWQDVAAASPTGEKDEAFTCLAYTSYASKKTDLGEQAAAQAVAQAPKLDQLELKQSLSSAKSSASTAEEAVSEDC